MMLHLGNADARNTSKQEVVHRSVTISSTAPNFVDCSNFRAAQPSKASRRQEMLYSKKHVRGCNGM